MQYKSLLILLLFGIFSIQSVTAQAPLTNKNQDTYWFYRHRLKNMFMKIGPGQGESLPAYIRNSTELESNWMKWSDTTHNLGFYISVLATEYKLLKNNGDLVGLKKTKTELYYALKALERLDYSAECTYPFNQPCNLNGYIMRDDVHSKIHWGDDDLGPLVGVDDGGLVWDNIPHFNKPRKMELFDMPHEVGFARSDYSDSNNFLVKEMSIDQFTGLLMGLILVYELTEDHNYTTDQVHDLDGNLLSDDGIEFKAVARANVKRMMDYMYDHNWQIRNPNGDSVWSGGGNPIAYLYGWKVIIKNSMGLNYNLVNPAFYTTFQFLPDVSTSMGGSFPTRGMALVAGALSDEWNDWFGLVNSTENSIHALGEYEKWEAYYLYLNWILHPNVENNGLYQLYANAVQTGLADPNAYGKPGEIFASVPCKGPKWLGIHQNDNNYPYGWKSGHRFWSREVNQISPNDADGDGSTYIGHFNGLDYMLIHNMFYLVTDHSLPVYDDREDRHYSTSIFTSNNGEININGISTLKADNLVNLYNGSSTTEVNFQANDQINLLPGFKAKVASPNSVFNARIVSEFECGTDGYERLANTEDLVSEDDFTEFENHKYTSSDLSEPEDVAEALVQIENNLAVYPNPNNGKFNINIKRLNQESHYRIFIQDFMGKIIFEQEVRNQDSYYKEFDFNNLPSGLYTITINDDFDSVSEQISITK